MKTARVLCLTLLLCGLPPASPGHGEPQRFAMLAKRVDHRFFILAAEGCAEAARARGDTCLLLGSPGAAHFRRQNKDLEQALGWGLDGIALSVIHSKWLAEHALRQPHETPLITYDSDLGPGERHLRRSYVGLDNLAFGRRLGSLAQRFRPQGGRLCVLSATSLDTNLQERLRGLRLQLRGGEVDAPEDAGHLEGENGWRELKRCPLYNANNQQSVLFQLVTLLNANPVDIIVSLGSWPIHRADEFRRQLGPLLAGLDARGARPAIVIATPEPDAAQLALLDDGLVQAYLSMESREIGRRSYEVMKCLAQGLPVPEKIFVDSHVHLPGEARDGSVLP